MLSERVVRLASLLVTLIAAVFFALDAWWIMSGRMEGFDGIFALGGCVMAGIVFAYRYGEPVWLQPLSIIKAR
jgi:hypothetical protein